MEYFLQPWGTGAVGVALFGAHFFFNGHIIGMFDFLSIIALVVGLIALRFGNDSPEAFGLGNTEALFDEPKSEEDEEAEDETLTKWQMFVTYVLKIK